MATMSPDDMKRRIAAASERLRTDPSAAKEVEARSMLSARDERNTACAEVLKSLGSEKLEILADNRKADILRQIGVRLGEAKSGDIISIHSELVARAQGQGKLCQEPVGMGTELMKLLDEHGLKPTAELLFLWPTCEDMQSVAGSSCKALLDGLAKHPSLNLDLTVLANDFSWAVVMNHHHEMALIRFDTSAK